MEELAEMYDEFIYEILSPDNYFYDLPTSHLEYYGFEMKHSHERLITHFYDDELKRVIGPELVHFDVSRINIKDWQSNLMRATFSYVENQPIELLGEIFKRLDEAVGACGNLINSKTLRNYFGEDTGAFEVHGTIMEGEAVKFTYSPALNEFLKTVFEAEIDEEQFWMPFVDKNEKIIPSITRSAFIGINLDYLTEQQGALIEDFMEDYLSLKNAFLSQTTSVSKDQNKIQPVVKEVPLMSGILFDPDIIDPLTESLKMYFDKTQWDDLAKTLQGLISSDKLVFKSTGNRLIFAFTQLKEKGLLVQDKTFINKWICSSFAYQDHKGEIRSFNPGYVKKILTGQANVSKESRISLHRLMGND